MRITIVGGHGQIARQLGRLAAEDGHDVVGLVRKPEQGPDLESDGVSWQLLDLEDTSVEQVTGLVRGADAVVFAAGGGADGDAGRKETVDKQGAIVSAEAAVAAGVRRFVVISSMGYEDADPDSDEVFQVYLRAKRDADEHVRSLDLDWTIVRPGRLTDDVPTGHVSVGDVEYGSVTRGDIAHVIAEALKHDTTVGKTFKVVGGETPIGDAVRGI